MKYYANIKNNEPCKETNPAKVISFGSENASFFYQEKEWISGRDMYYIDTSMYSNYICFFLISCLETLTSKYSYNFGLFPDLLKDETIKLPINIYGEPDWQYMYDYMKNTECKVRNILNML